MRSRLQRGDSPRGSACDAASTSSNRRGSTCRPSSAGCARPSSCRLARSPDCPGSRSRPCSRTNWPTSDGTIISSTRCRASSRRCSSSTRPSGGSPEPCASSASTAATMPRWLRAAARSSTRARWPRSRRCGNSTGRWRWRPPTDRSSRASAGSSGVHRPATARARCQLRPVSSSSWPPSRSRPSRHARRSRRRPHPRRPGAISRWHGRRHPRRRNRYRFRNLRLSRQRRPLLHRHRGHCASAAPSGRRGRFSMSRPSTRRPRVRPGSRVWSSWKPHSIPKGPYRTCGCCDRFPTWTRLRSMRCASGATIPCCSTASRSPSS